MKPLKIVLALLALLSVLFHLAILFIFTSVLTVQGVRPDWPIVLYWLAIAMGCLTALGTLIFTPLRRSAVLAGINGVVFLVMTASLVWYLGDAPPMAEDYSEETLRCPANGSYELLQVFNDDQISRQAKADLKKGEVLKAWEDILPFRNTIKALDDHDLICDLPPGKPIDMQTPFLKFSALRDMAEIYHAHCLDQVAAGNGLEAARELLRLHRVSRKGITQASLVINKLIFTALAKATLKSANAILQHPRCDQATLQALHDGFTPLEAGEYTMARAFIGEYLMIKNTMARQVTPEGFLDSVMFGADETEQSPKGIPFASRLAYYFGFKPNQSLRDIRELFDLLIASQEKHPPDFSAAVRFAEEYARKPQLRNMVGWILNTIALPSFENYSQRGVEVKVQSDLLAVALSRKLGLTPPVQDYFNGGQYRFRQEGETFRHPGADGDYDTPDDILLGVEPL
jgi:hypothetical protein